MVLTILLFYSIVYESLKCVFCVCLLCLVFVSCVYVCLLCFAFVLLCVFCVCFAVFFRLALNDCWFHGKFYPAVADAYTAMPDAHSPTADRHPA